MKSRTFYTPRDYLNPKTHHLNLKRHYLNLKTHYNYLFLSCILSNSSLIITGFQLIISTTPNLIHCHQSQILIKSLFLYSINSIAFERYNSIFSFDILLPLNDSIIFCIALKSRSSSKSIKVYSLLLIITIK